MRAMALLDACGEERVLREEAEAGVKSRATGLLGRLDDPFHVEIRGCRLGGADADGLVREAQPGGTCVGDGVHGHRADSHLAAGAKDACGDLAAVGHEKTTEHSRQSSRRRLHLAAMLSISFIVS
jgi:hypothetical protein